MTKQEFEDRMKMILEVDKLEASKPLSDVDSFSRVEIIMAIEEYKGKQLQDCDILAMKTYKDIMELVK
jgi:acyl carrier protein